MPSAVRVIIIANVVGFVLEAGGGAALVSTFGLWSLQAGFLPWQLFTYAFLHANLTHIAVNMYGIWMFGRDLEAFLGRKVFLKLYFASVLSAGLMQLLVASAAGSPYPTVGASGGAFGVLLAYGICFPNRTIMLLLPPISMPAWLFVLLYAGLELTLGVTGTQAGVAHFAHLGGMIGGYLVVHHWLGQRR